MTTLDNYYFLFSHQPSLDWDPHSFGQLGDLHELMNMPLDMESPVSSEASTGYLQDAVAEWSDRCKRQRVAPCPSDSMAATEDLQDLLQGFWDSNCHGDPLGNLNCLIQNNSTVSGETKSADDNLKESSSSAPPLQLELPSPPSFSHKDSILKDQDKKDIHGSKISKSTHPPTLKEKKNERQKQKKKKVVYPFAVVKPVGLEGDVTLADINERILMRPTRPVRHPVGEFACGPCVSADGPGLSGKAVVGLTRIHTQGRGTITIIRTRG